MTEMKRCGGVTYPGDKTRVLRDPHMEPKENFYKKSVSPDGLTSKCRSCFKVYDSEKKSLPQIDPPEFMTCRVCDETKHHSEMINDSSKLNGKAKICMGCKSSNSSQWAKDNPEKARAKNQRRKDRLRSQPNEKVSKEILLEIHGPNCYLCGLPVPEELGLWHMEHVIPSSRGNLGTTYENCRVSHQTCNNSKWAKTYFEVVVGTESGWKNFNVSNLFLFNENAEWHYQQIFKEALERAKQ